MALYERHYCILAEGKIGLTGHVSDTGSSHILHYADCCDMRFVTVNEYISRSNSQTVVASALVDFAYGCQVFMMMT